MSAIAELVEHTEASAYVDLFRAAPRSFGLELLEADGVTALMAPGIDILLFNRVMGLGLGRDARPDQVEALVSRYREAGVRNFGVQLSPAAQPSSLPETLAGCGLEVRDNWTKVYRLAEPGITLPTDLRIERIGRDLADRFAAVACAGFGMPPALQPLMAASVGRTHWHHYMAWDDDVPAAVAALFIRDGAGWLGVAATLPAYRRRGAQGALMARRLQDGAALGCRWFATETGQDRPDKPNPSFHNMQRAGFVVAYQRPNYMPPPTRA